MQEQPQTQQSSRRHSESGLQDERPQSDWRRQPAQPHAGVRVPAVAPSPGQLQGHDDHRLASHDQHSAHRQPPPPWQVPATAAHGLPAPQPWYTTPAPAPPTHMAGSGVLQAPPPSVSSAGPASPLHGTQAHAASMRPGAPSGSPYRVPPPAGPVTGTAAARSARSDRADVERPASAPPWLNGTGAAWPAPSANISAGPALVSRQPERRGQQIPTAAGGTILDLGDNCRRHSSADVAVDLDSRDAASQLTAQQPRQDKAAPEHRRARHGPNKEVQKQVRQLPS